jgi:beta-galactosidase
MGRKSGQLCVAMIDMEELIPQDRLVRKIREHIDFDFIYSVDILFRALLESAQGIYHFDWLDQCFERLYRNGQRIILVAPSGSKPVWLSKKYPEVCRMDANGLRRQRHDE